MSTGSSCVKMLASRAVKVLLVASAAVNLLLLANVMLWKCTAPTTDSTVSPLPPRVAELPPPPHVVNPPAPHVDEPPAPPQEKKPVQNNSLDSVIFVGGVPRSGTTLVRAMLDAHPDIRCGEETRVLPRILSMRSKWSRSEKEHYRLIEAGLSDQLLDQATKAFVSYIITHHGEPAKHLCNKDPLLLNNMEDLKRLFPKAKFVLMIRDGRAVAYSIISRNVTITGVNSKDFMSAAMFWNRVVQRMVGDCVRLGKSVCMEVRYEGLVKEPRKWMAKILEFVGIPWHENVLHHQDFINKGVSVSK